MNAKTNYYIRKTHRWLGVFIGIQFLAWTIGGLYFSWSDMDEVHGDYEKAPPVALPADAPFTYPQAALDSLRRSAQADSIADIRLISILGKAHWQIHYFAKGHRHHKRFALADAQSGAFRAPLSEAEAVAVARAGFAGKASVQAVETLTETNGHHEYRESPLPAVAVRFDDPRATTVYVSTELGTPQKFRNQPWRRFDFLWMLHTMDFSTRDHIGNWLLRALSILGLTTVLSGFLLFFISRKSF